MKEIIIDFTKEEKENLKNSTMYYIDKDGKMVEAYGIEEIIKLTNSF